MNVDKQNFFRNAFESLFLLEEKKVNPHHALDKKTEISAEKQYEYLSAQLRYLDNKIFRAYALFVTIAAAIIGGTFYLYLQKDNFFILRSPHNFGLMIDFIFLGICFGSNLVITNNLRSWWDHRKRIESYTTICSLQGPWWWLNEIFGCIAIGIVSGVFLYFNPFRPLLLNLSIILSLICFALGSLPLVPIITNMFTGIAKR